MDLRSDPLPKNEDASSRRSFLKKSATAVAATSALAPSMVHAAEPTKKKIRIGVCGGRFGCGFPWHKHPNCEVVAVADLRADRRERLQKKFSPKKVYESLAEMVTDPSLDAIGIYTDGPLHSEHVELAMRHGKHTISAVPAVMTGGVEEAEFLLETVKRYGQTYMMAETSYFQQATISARKFYQEGAFGDLFYCESQYDHPGLDVLYTENGKRTWRWGMAPMLYPTHCTAHLVGVTGERLTEVSCQGIRTDHPWLKENAFNNPFGIQVAMFKTNRNHPFRVRVSWEGALRGGEYAQWYGSKTSFHMHHPNGHPSCLIRSGKQMGKDDAGFAVALPPYEEYKQPLWWKTDMLPESLRFSTGHEGSHGFLVNEFINALVEERRPAIDVYEALAYTVPGMIAHESSLRDGETLKIPQFDRPEEKVS